ncbi:MAG: peroxidase-related enzyme [Anaerolineae bacterium]
MTIELYQNEKISWLEMPLTEVDDPGMQKLFAKAKEVFGFIPNVFLGYTIRPTHFTHWFNHFKAVTQGEGELTLAEREMIAVVVSNENGCLYCLVSHGADLRMKLGDPILGDRIMFDYQKAGLDEETMAILDYAAKITMSPLDCGEGDIEYMRQLGFSDQKIFDIAECAAMYNFTNRLASATGMMPNPEYHGMGR